MNMTEHLERLANIKALENKLNELPIPKKSVQVIGSTIHITISGHGATSTVTANKWIGVLSKLGKVHSKSTIQESADTDQQRGIVGYVDAIKVWCKL